MLTRPNPGRFGRSAHFAGAVFATIVAAAMFAFLVLAGAASAEVTPSLAATYLQNGTSTVVVNPVAGAHYDYRQVTNIATTNDDDVQRLNIDYPAGLIGDPNAVASANRCNVDYTGVNATSGSPDYSTCQSSAPGSRVGTIGATASSGLTCSDISLSGSIYLLRNRPTPDPEVPTYLGIHLSGSANIALLFCLGVTVNLDMTAKITLRPTDNGLRIQIIDNLTRTDPIIGGPIRIKTIDQKIFGMAPAPSTKPFLTMPTRCDAWATKVYTRAYTTNPTPTDDIDPVDGTNESESSTSNVTPSCAGIAATAFGFAMTTTNSQAGRPVGVRATMSNTVVTTNTNQPAYAKTFALQMPVGYKINPAIANRLGAVGCTESQFLRPAAGTAVTEAAPTCPTSSEVGTTAVSAPEITGSLVGRLYIGDPLAGDEAAGIYRLYVYAARGGVVTKFQGKATVNAANGQVTVTMDNTPVYTTGLPQFNYSQFILDFDTNSAGVGSPSSGAISSPNDNQQMIVNPQVCGSYTATATLTPWTNPTQAATTFSPSFNITSGTNGSCSFDAFNPGFSANLSDTGAGKHPNLNLTVTRGDRQDNLRDMTFRLPPGFAGSVTAASICSAVDAAAGTCNTTTPLSKVGDVTVLTGEGPETATLTGTVHLTTPTASDTAKLAIIVPAVVGPFDLGSVVIYSSLRLNSTTAFGLDSITTSMPQTIMGIPTLYRSVSLSLNGIIGGKPFLQNPSQCQTLNFQGTMTSNGDLSGPALPGSGSNSTVVKTDTDQSTTGCASQTFNPTLGVTAATTATDTATGLTLTVSVPQTTSGVTTATIQQSTVKRMQLTFPSGMEMNPSFAAAATACTTANIDAGGGSCAASSQIGSIAINTPLLASVVTGKVYLETPGATAATRYKIALVIDMPGGQQIIHGSTGINGSSDILGGTGAVGSGTGQVTADFNNLPDVPFSSMALAFNSAVPMFVNPSTCGTQTFSSTITPTNGSLAPVARNGTYTTSYNGSGGACSGDPWTGAPTPGFTQTVSTAVALAHPNLGLTVTRNDKDQDLRDMTFSLPAGLTGRVPATSQFCTQASADAGTCGTTAAASIIGSTTVQIGSGASPASVSGTIYNTVSPATQPAKFTAIVDVNVGPFSLGKMSIPVNVTMRSDYGLDAAVTNLPQRYEGIRVHYRSLAMTINGTATQGTGSAADDVPFLTNPSGCQSNTTSAALTSTLSNTVTKTQSYTTTGCPIAFGTAPTFGATPTTTAAQTPSGWGINVGNATTNPTIKRIQVAFPVGVEINPAVGNGPLTACTTVNIDAGGASCSAASNQGTVSVTTPLLTGTFTGNVYLETPGTTAATRYKLAIVVHLPGRDLIIHGGATVNGSSNVTAGTGIGSTDTGTGQVIADFNNIPDLSFSSMTLNLNSGARALLINGTVCSAQTVQATITPTSGGADATPTASFTPTACSNLFTPAFSGSVSTAVANGHPNLTLSVTDPDKDQQLRNLNFHLPTGLVANTTATTQCTQANAALGNCAAGQAVGTVATSIGNGAESYALSGSIYNVVPNASEPARLQAIIPVVVGPFDLGKLTIPVTTSLRSDFGIDTATQLPLRYEGIAVRIRSLSMVLNGVVGGNNFMTNPSKCQSNTVSADMISPTPTTVTGNFSFTTTGCPAGFGSAPTLGVTPSTTVAQTPVGLTVGVNSAATNPTIKRIQLALPTGMEINPAFGNGPLTACAPATVDAGGAGCPATSAVGTVSLTTPLLPAAQSGTVYLETPGTTATTRYKLAIVIHLPGRDMVVRGAVQVNGSSTIIAGATGAVDSGTGQVTADFDNIPDLGFTNMTLTFNSGNRAMLINPTTCAAQTFNSTITPNSLGADATPTAAYTTTACTATFAPVFTGSVSTAVANGHPNLTLGVTSPDKDAQLRNLNFHLPTGLVASTTAVPQCTQANAAAGNCVAGNAVGTVATSIGNGGESYALSGTIYNVVPNASEPARLQAVIPVVVGPFDLGKLSIPVSTSIRADLGVDTATQLPLRYEGIAVRIRSLSMVLNGVVGGNNFMTSPSKCQSNTVSADMISPTPTTVTGNFSFTTTGCPVNYGTAPTLTVTPSTTVAQTPVGLTIGVNSAATNPTTKRIQLAMPVGMEVNPAFGNGPLAACATATIDAGGAGCPATSNVGTVSLTTPLLSSAQSGNVYLETPGVTATTRYKLAIVVHLPGRDLVVHGSVQVNGSSTISAGATGAVDTGTGQVTADFDNIPDLGFTNMTLALNSGNRAMLINPTTCSAQTFNGTLTPNSGGTDATPTANYTPTACTSTFAPVFTGSVSTAVANGHPNLTLGVTSPDKDA
ncbi:MAG: beta strand repeat-containing protein, partial [Solirubrobacterales bacterium]